VIKTIIAIVAALVIIVVGLSIYLAPNDLAKCADHPSSVEGCEMADAIVAVSGGDTPARTAEAIQLYKNGWAPKLIFSGAALDKSGPSNAEVMQSQALGSGVPASDILIEEQGETTRENAEKTENILTDNGISSVILVTSGYHQRRAGLEFNDQTQGIEVRNHPVATDKQWSAWWWLTPGGWFLAVSEFIKIIAFFIGGTR
jgi:uncharacterized SAM-binding protein YcdF (DUF218 family)